MSLVFTAIFRYDDLSPATGLSINVEVRDLYDDTIVVSGGVAHEVGGGWYDYSFDSDVEGHNYVCTFDAGTVAQLSKRYSDGTNMPRYDTKIADLKSDLTTALALLNSIVKVDYGSWEVKAPGVLIFYDTDNVTPIAQYQCYDINGNQATSEIVRVVRFA